MNKTKNTPLDLLGMLYSIGFSITENSTGIWYASKIVKGHRIGFFADDVNELYRLCVNSVYDVRFC